LQFAGDNAVRKGDDMNKFQEMTSFAWEAYDRGQDVHMQALPSQAEILHKQFREKKDALKKQQQEALAAKYGGAEHLKPSEPAVVCPHVLLEGSVRLTLTAGPSCERDLR
jgi:hypothetical protein